MSLGVWLLILTVFTTSPHAALGLDLPTFTQIIGKISSEFSASQHAQHMHSQLKNFDLSRLIEHFIRLQAPPGNDSQCYADLASLAMDLYHNKSWPLAFVDAFGKLPSGLTLGNLGWLGEFSQCREIQVPNKTTNETLYNGKYCMAYIPLTAQARNAPTIRLGTCFPESCMEDTIMLILNDFISKVLPSISAKAVHCNAKEKPGLSSGSLAMLVILAVIGGVTVCGTLYDIFEYRPKALKALIRRPSESSDYLVDSEVTSDTGLLTDQTATNLDHQTMFGRILLCFSVVENGSKILNTQTDGQTLSALHGIRFLSMSWIILGHSLAFIIYFAIVNPSVMYADYIRRFSFQTILNATVSVDSFFLLSGILASYLLLGQMRTSGGPSKVNWALVYFHRFWRLTPAYMLILGIYATLYIYLGSGPFYPQTPDKNCNKNWWQNLLYINNFVPSTDACIDWTWFLANDMQFFLISPLVVVLLYKWVIAGTVAVVLLIITNIVTVWVLIQINNFPSTLGAVDMLKATQNSEFDMIYVRPYCRVGAYAVGLGLGYLLYRCRDIRLHKWVVTVGWLLATACNLSVLYGLYGLADGRRTLTPTVNAMYGALHRVAWSLGLGWLVFACCTGHGGPVNKLLSWSVFVPLSRLTYMAYLIHPIVIFWVYSSMEQPLFISDISIIYLFLGHLFLSYGLAFVLSVTLESPMIGLGKLLLPQRNR